MTSNQNPTQWLAEMRALEHEGDVEFDRSHSDELWNALGSRSQEQVEQLRKAG